MLESLYKQWIALKDTERSAAEQRRAIEDEILRLANVSGEEGVHTIESEAYKVKATVRYNRRVDADEVERIARETGLIEQSRRLFKWTPEFSATAWKNTAPNLTEPFLSAITTKPGRPTFHIEAKGE